MWRLLRLVKAVFMYVNLIRIPQKNQINGKVRRKARTTCTFAASTVTPIRSFHNLPANINAYLEVYSRFICLLHKINFSYLNQLKIYAYLLARLRTLNSPQIRRIYLQILLECRFLCRYIVQIS